MNPTAAEEISALVAEQLVVRQTDHLNHDETEEMPIVVTNYPDVAGDLLPTQDLAVAQQTAPVRAYAALHVHAFHPNQDLERYNKLRLIPPKLLRG